MCCNAHLIELLAGQICQAGADSVETSSVSLRKMQTLPLFLTGFIERPPSVMGRH